MSEGTTEAEAEVQREALVAIARGRQTLDRAYLAGGDARDAAYADALRDFAAARALDPTSLEATLGVARAQYGLGRFDQARVGFERARRLDDASPDAHWGLALSLVAAARRLERDDPADESEHRRLLERAGERLERVTELEPTFVSAWTLLGDVLVSLGKDDAALELLDRGAAANPSTAELPLARARVLHARGRPEEALRDFTLAYRLAGHDGSLVTRAEAGVAMGLLLYDREETPEALRMFREVLALADVDDPPAELADHVLRAHFYAALALARLRQWAEVNDQLGLVAQETTPLAMLAITIVINVLGELGRYGEAWELLPRALELAEDLLDAGQDPTDPDFAKSYGDVLRRSGRGSEAVEIYAAAIGRHPDASFLRFELIATHMEQRDADVASGPVGSRATGTSAREDRFDRQMHRASCWGSAIDEFSRARMSYEAALNENRTVKNLVALGGLHVLLGDDDTARPFLEEAIGRSRRQGVASYERELAHAHLAISYARKGDPAGALREYEAALSHDPDDLRYRLGSATACFRLGRLDEAETLCRAVLAVAPGNVEAHVRLAAVLAAQADEDRPDRHTSAIEEIEEAIRLSARRDQGSTTLSRRTLASLHYQVGYAYTRLYDTHSLRASLDRDRPERLSRAIEAFRTATELDPDHAGATAALDCVRSEKRRHARGAEQIAPWLLIGACLVPLVVVHLGFLWPWWRERLPPSLGTDLRATTYTGLVFGLLVILVAVVSLPQLLKLKVAGVSLEKAPIEPEAPIDLAIAKAEFDDIGTLMPLGHADIELPTTVGPLPGEAIPVDDDDDAPTKDARDGPEASRDERSGTGRTGAEQAKAAGDSATPNGDA